jgi:ATP-binding cassette subfamily B protein
MKNKRYTIIRFFPFTKGYRKNFITAGILVILGVIASYMTPQVIRIIVDSVIGDAAFALPTFLLQFVDKIGGREFLRSNMLLCAAVTLVLALFSNLCDYFTRKNIATGSEGTIRSIRNRLYEHIQLLPYDWHNSHQTGDIIQRCSNDVDTVKDFLSEQLQALVRTIFLITVSLFLMFPMNFDLTMVAVAFIPVTLAYSGIFYLLTAKRFRYADEAEGQVNAIAQENFTGVRVVRAFGRERFEADKFRKATDEVTRLWTKLGVVMGLNWGIGDFISFAQVITIVILGVQYAVAGKITAGEFIAFISYNFMLIWPIRSLGRVLSDLSRSTISTTRLMEILNAEEEKDAPDAITPPMDRDIEFSHVTFSYNDVSSAVNDISFSVKNGSTLGILGATGSGKSTLMYLLDRLYELPEGNGKITIGGVDIRKIKLRYLRKNIGIVLQEPFLFSKSFRESISEGSSAHDIEAVRHYAKIAVIDDTISNFQDGYDTQIGERGVTISGGQKQRVAIARMLMQDTPIKIFDDSLSAVDMETDAKIRASLNANVGGTTILIAHRIATLMNADKIIVIDKGKLVQEGTHEELIHQEGIYKRIYDTQKPEEEQHLR